MFSFFFGKKSKSSPKAKKINRRSLRFESLEEKVVLSVSPLTEYVDFKSLETSSYDLISTLTNNENHFSGDILGEIGLSSEIGHSDVASTSTQAEWSAARAYYENMTGIANVKNLYGLDGFGQTVVVIDSGAAYDLPSLGGGLGTSYKIIYGYDYTENDYNPYDDYGNKGHGTHVTGIIVSNNPDYPGVAPGVDIVVLRVLGDNGSGSVSNIGHALDFVHNNRNSFRYPITAVNVSIGLNDGYTAQDAADVTNFLSPKYELLKNDGIFTTVSAGNYYPKYTGLDPIAASPHVVAVGSYDTGGYLAGSSQRSSLIIAAPGVGIRNAAPSYTNSGVGYQSMNGTSMAAPYVAAASTLIRQAYQLVGQTNVNQDTIKNLMSNNADVILHSATNTTTTYKGLDIWRAIDAILPDDLAGETSGTALTLTTTNGRFTHDGFINTTSEKDYFSFKASMSGSMTIKVEGITGGKGVWDLSKISGAVVNADGSITFNVTLNQNYTFGYNANGKIGAYFLNATTVPRTPTGLAATVVSSSQINLSWNASAGATSYTLERSTTGSSGWTSVYSGTARSYQHTGLSANTLYHYRVRAINSNSSTSSDNSLNVSARTKLTTPAAPTVSAISSSQISVSWSAVSGATSYTLERSTTGTGGWTSVYSGTARSHQSTGLSANTVYYYRVSAINSNTSTSSDNSLNASARTKLATPATPTISTISPSQINVSWGTVSGATSYTLERSTNQSSWTTIYTGTNTNYVNSLSPNTKYYYRLKATSSNNSSNYSGTATFTSGNFAQPIANIENSNSLTVQEGCTLRVSGSGIDPLGQGLTYLWDLTDSGIFVASSDNSAWFSAANINGRPGETRTIQLKVRDANGVESPIVSANVSIVNVAPTIIVTPPSSSELFAYNPTIWTFTAYDVPSDPVMKWVVTWGDGSTETINGGPRPYVTLRHVFTSAGTYTITIKTTDLDGIESAVSAVRFTILPPVI